MIFLCALAPFRSVRADADWRWRTLRGPHVSVHYPAGAELDAKRCGELAEQALLQLASRLGHMPSRRVHVTLHDEVDEGDGSANALPYPRMNIALSTPHSLSQLASHDDWHRLLIFHEMTHVVNIDIVEGAPKLYNFVLGLGGLGLAYSPSRIAPNWWIEGLATMEESSLTSQGRGRSAYFDMMLRMAVHEDRLLSADQVNSGPTIFPYGTAAYLYGLHFMYYVSARYGHEALTNILHRYGRRLVPGGLNRAFEEVIGIDADQVWKELYSVTTARFRAQVRALSSRGLRQGRRLTFTTAGSSIELHASSPFWSPGDTHIYFTEHDGHSPPRVARISREGGHVREGWGGGRSRSTSGIETVFGLENASRASFVGTRSDQIVFDSIKDVDARKTWSDLFIWNGDRQNIERLTKGLRARQPMVSPDGRRVAFVRNDRAHSRLAILDLESKQVREITPLHREQQVHDPVWSPDGREIAVSIWQPGGYRDLYVFDIVANTWTRLTWDRAMVVTPAYTPDGQYIIYSNDIDGVFNLYAVDRQSHRQWQVSNVLGGAFSPTVSHDGETIAYIGYTSTGFDLWSLPLDKEQWMPFEPRPSSLPRVKLDGYSDPEVSQFAWEEKPYRAYRTFFPRTLLPNTLSFESSSFLDTWSVATEIEDVAGLHRLGATLSYIPDVSRVGTHLVYENSMFLPSLRLRWRRGYTWRDDDERYGDGGPNIGPEDDDGYLRRYYLEQSSSAIAEVGVDLYRSVQRRAEVELEYHWNRFVNESPEAHVEDPNAPSRRPPTLGTWSGFEARFVARKTQPGSERRYSYDGELGRRSELRISVDDPRLGGNRSAIRAEIIHGQVWSLANEGRYAVAWRVAGGASSGADTGSAFRLGGFAPTDDLLRGLLTFASLSEGGRLRGYPQSVLRGRRYALGNLEFRLPVLDVERGMNLLPSYLRRVSLTAFTDWGAAFDSLPEWGEREEWKEIWAASAGASMVFELGLGYGTPMNLSLMWAHAWKKELRGNSVQVLLVRPF